MRSLLSRPSGSASTSVFARSPLARRAALAAKVRTSPKCADSRSPRPRSTTFRAGSLPIVWSVSVCSRLPVNSSFAMTGARPPPNARSSASIWAFFAPFFDVRLQVPSTSTSAVRSRALACRAAIFNGIRGSSGGMVSHRPAPRAKCTRETVRNGRKYGRPAPQGTSAIRRGARFGRTGTPRPGLRTPPGTAPRANQPSKRSPRAAAANSAPFTGGCRRISNVARVGIPSTTSAIELGLLACTQRTTQGMENSMPATASAA